MQPTIDKPSCVIVIRTLALAIAAALASLGVAHLAFQTPSLEGRTVTYAVQASDVTPLGRVALSRPDGQVEQSGVLPLLSGPDAFVARIALIRAAKVAVDVQYYIWQRDDTGLILLDELRKAAERGVRVRLLLDDNGITGLDGDLAALAAMPQGWRSGSSIRSSSGL
ncbi:hypothetical protein CYG48_18705 (plasmid) [Neorhizobium sp. SOG26]|nr:hypothetical protein CYG48_18705 [Neorhizobium sp. SOG26]